MAIYEFLIRGDSAGNIVGAHVLSFGPDGRVNPASLAELSPADLAQIPEWAIELMASTNNNQAITAAVAAKDTEIAALKLDLAPEIKEITPALMAAGLNAWGARATKNPQIMDMLMALFAIASEPRSAGQCHRISTLFVEICNASLEVPTSAEAQAMQTILDVGPPSTGPIASKYLSFEPWMQPADGA
jgi:hypothetical protein